MDFGDLVAGPPGANGLADPPVPMVSPLPPTSLSAFRLVLSVDFYMGKFFCTGPFERGLGNDNPIEMAQHATYHNLLLGQMHGDFHSLHFMRNGTMEEKNYVLNGISGGGGGGGAVTSVALPLSLANGNLTIDLTAYSNTSEWMQRVTFLTWAST